MKGQTRSPGIRRAIDKARRLGFRVTFREFVADSRTPMAHPLQMAGRCDHERREIIVGTRDENGPMSKAKMLAILEHEIEHAEGADRGTDHPEHGLRCGGTWGAP